MKKSDLLAGGAYPHKPHSQRSNTGSLPIGLRSAVGIADSVRSGRLSARRVVQACQESFDRTNAQLNAFVFVDWEAAEQAAEEVDRAVAAGRDPGPFAGVPFGVKDLEDCAGMPTSQGSLLFKGGPNAVGDSVHVSRLRAAGAVPVGKTAASEFGMDSATHTRAWGTTRNPWRLDRTPGGSSGGSAAAVAAGIVPLATGTDAGGSIRSPAAFTSLVGLKPSQGRVPHVSTYDFSVCGVLTNNIADTARYLDVAAGPDSRDKSSLPAAGVVYEESIRALGVAGLRACWSSDLGYAAVESEVVEIARDAAMRLIDAAKLKLIDCSFAPPNPYLTWANMVGHRVLGELHAYGLWPDDRGIASDSTRYWAERLERLTLKAAGEAWIARGEIEAQTARLFEQVDLLMTPTVACRAFNAEGPIPTVIAGRDAEDSGAEPFTVLANMTWHPALPVPAGLSRDGLPVGLQIIGPRWRDDIVLRLGQLLEDVGPFPRLSKNE